MELTWKDAVSTVFMAAIAVIYVSFLNSTTAWLISSARGTAAAVLVLGIVGGCGMGAAAEQYQGKKAWAYTSFASVLGAAASTVALAIPSGRRSCCGWWQRCGTRRSRAAPRAAAVTPARSSIRRSPALTGAEALPPAEVQGRDRR
jgi:hypothetical protein